MTRAKRPALEITRGTWVLPDDVEMGGSTPDEDEVDRALAMDLISDLDVAGARVGSVGGIMPRLSRPSVPADIRRHAC
jgi:hypothetical protein